MEKAICYENEDDCDTGKEAEGDDDFVIERPE